MIIHFDSGDQIRGDLIVSAAIRTDLAPVPMTLELTLVADSSVLAQVKEGKILTTGHGDRLRIMHSKPIQGGMVKGDRLDSAVQIVAFLDECAPATFLREKAIIKSNQTLHSIYRACGCSLRSVDADFPVPRFVCMVGDTPSFHIARALQEAGGVVRWKKGRLEFMTLRDLLRQTPVMKVPSSASQDVESQFLERHEAPSFFTVLPDGSIEHGNKTKARASNFMPHLTQVSLNNMGRVLVRRKETRIDYAGHLCAGDVLDFQGGPKLAIITACHYFESGTDRGGAQQAYTKVWAGGLM